MHSSKASRGGGDSLERAILTMTAGAPLLKFAKDGKPGFRPYQLSSDLLALQWQSSKSATKSQVRFQDMTEIRFGQRTDKFKKKINRPDLEHLSFSIMHKDDRGNLESLDLVCKDEAEFQMWTSTLETLRAGKTDLTQYLLAVQKRQLDSIARNEAAGGVGGGIGGGGPGGVEGAGERGRRILLKSKGAFKETEADVYAFGWGEWGQNGTGVSADMEACANPKLLESLLGKHVVAIAQGWSHTCVLLESGELMQYGNRIGTGLSEDFVVPTVTPLGHLNITEKTNIVSLACGAFHSAALTERGQVLTWGSNVNGQLGHGHKRDSKEPRFVEALRSPPSSTPAPSTSTPPRGAAPPPPVSPSSSSSAEPVFVVSLLCGSSLTACLSDTGEVYTWGSGAHGVLGHNDLLDRLVPTKVQDLAGTDITKLAVGDCHMFACTARETYAWGWNACNQLGLGGAAGESGEDQLRPHVVESLRGLPVQEIAAGATHSVALVRVGPRDVLFTWGSNVVGQSGQGSKRSKIMRPTPVPELRGVMGSVGGVAPMHAAWASGNPPPPSTPLSAHSAALVGAAAAGAVGAYSGEGGPVVVEIKCGAFHTLVRTAAGEVLATGSNRFGQCGVNMRAPASANHAVSGGSGGSPPLVPHLDEFRPVDLLKDKLARALCAGGQSSAVLSKRAWVEDHAAADCMGCRAQFTFVNRKHHCRNCGGIFCGACSSKKIAILRIQVTEPVRVCNSCYTMLGGR